MKFRRLLMFSGLLAGMNAVVAQDSLQSRIVLIGDAGELTKGRHPVVDAVRKTIPFDSKTTFLFLGDNLYKTGLPDNSLPTYDIAKAPLDSQIHIARNHTSNVYFIPGNHDWANGGRNGFESVLRVQSYIDVLANQYVKQLPRDGCPGPEEVKVTDDITMILMDSQWWLHEFDKPGVESGCPYKTKAEVITQLEDILQKNSKKLIIFATHHPFRSYGPHGGYFKLKQHIFPFTDVYPNLYIPLPLIGSSYPLTRAVFGTTQDLKHPVYQDMMRQIEPVIKTHPNVIYAAGHEHSLQLSQDSGYYFIVSGSGCKLSRVSDSKKTLYTAAETGFVILDISKNKNVDVKFYTVDGDSVRNTFNKHLLDFSKLPPEEKPDSLRQVAYQFKDSVVISASSMYPKRHGFNKMFLGDNYRDVWNTPVTFKMFNIRKEMGGFEITGVGGGKQTKSLRLKDKNGKEWALRTIEKDPEKALPENLRGTIAQKIVEDMISASEPYAPLVVPTLAKATGVISEQPKYYFVPDDPQLGRYRDVFANRVVMLEDRDPVPSGDTKSTSTIVNKMFEDNDHHVDQHAVLRARLLDMLVADFDRHADQWKWDERDTGKGKLYYPVPRDRDQAFFYSNGLLVKFLGRNRMRFLQGFKHKVDDIEGLNFVAKDFDRAFLNSINADTWNAITDTFVKNLTNEVIDESVTHYPREIRPLLAAKQAQKLKDRRDHLKEESYDYYRYISRKVTVTGSNEPEYFHLTNDRGNLKLSVYKKDEKSDSSHLMFSRSFDPKVTKELRLFSLNGDDKFEIDDDVSSPIRLRLIGGKGNDTFNLKGNVKNFLYDLRQEKNVLLSTNRTNLELSGDVSVLDYKNNSFQYDQFIFPQVNFGFNPEDGFLAGLGFNWTSYGFRKEPYSTNQKLITLFAPARNGAYQARYKGEFNKIIFKNDLLFNAEFVNPTLNNFFGFGNSTVFDKSKGVEYYRVRYKNLATDLLLRNRMTDFFSVAVGPAYYRYWIDYEDNDNRILGKPANIGSDSASIYSLKHYLGFKARADINFVNNSTFPTRGITWFNEFTGMGGLNDNSHRLMKLTSDMTIYATVSDRSKITTVLRFGGGHIFTKNPEYFQALSLGANNYVRGFRKNRFSGTSMAYTSAEFRFKIFKSKSYVLPGDVGLVGYYDMGRVWMKGEDSRKWHNSIGGGLYFVPFNVVMLSATVGVSDEDRLFNFTVGTKFNLTF